MGDSSYLCEFPVNSCEYHSATTTEGGIQMVWNLLVSY